MVLNRRIVLSFCILLFLGTTSTAAAKTVLNVWFSTQTPQALEVMKSQLIPAFEKAYPDITVEFTTVEWNVRDEKLKVAFAGGVAPDIYEIGSDLISGDVANGFPLALDSRLAKWAGRADIIPESWKPTLWNGRQYGVPFTLTGRHLFYFTSVFEEAGLNGAQSPRTWDDLIDFGRKLLRTGSDGKTQRLGFYWGWSQPQAFYWYLWQNKAEIVDEKTGAALFNTAEGRETLTFLRDSFRMQGPPAGYPTFVNRGVGINFNPTHAVANEVRRNAPSLFEELRMFTIERKGSTVWPLYVNSLGITSQSKNPDAAWSFLTWFSSIENTLPYIENVGILSPNRRALGSEYIQKTMKPVQGIYIQADSARRNFIFPGITQANVYIQGMLTKVINDQISPEEALSQAEFEWNKIRNSFYK